MVPEFGPVYNRGIGQEASSAPVETMQPTLPTTKSDYNIEEAARVLGISSSELRSLLIRHVLDEPEGIRNLPKMRFRPADLVMLRLVANTGSG